MTESKRAYFSPELFRFLKQVKRHNNRDWFLANKARYQADVRDPCLRFITDFAPHLQGIAPRFAAVPKPTGGSLFRIYRDTRFSADKSPYKTHVGMHFPHKLAGRDVHAPGWYLHLQPGASFAAAGLWHPDGPTLRKVRDAIVQQPKMWRAIHRAGLRIEGDALVSPPRGYDREHPFIDDLKRKDFVTSITFSDVRVQSSLFLEEFARACRRMRVLVEFLTEAVGLPF
jgi:uncharacterized protein (TIGR02453 family)